ncbi:hypothetical protein SLS59_009756 [Nothophoma quercina]|uniref:Rhodopsin domain-containing protein n=1 Tax=Nothophoma quercina TaxID=749835 RepID=A0ABR3QJR5_9PLEO
MVDTSLQTLAYGVAYATFGIGLSTVVLRIYCRHFLLGAWGSDDTIALFVGAILKILFIEEVYYYFVHWVIKFAFLFFYLRLSPDKTFRRLVYLGMTTNITIFIANILIACLQCMPFDEILHPGTHPDARCIPKIVVLIVPSILVQNIVQDIYILILPVPTVLHLQMSTRRKIAVLSVISFGVSAVLVACFRLIPLLELNSSPDVSYALGKMVIVAAVEVQLAIELQAIYIEIFERQK